MRIGKRDSACRSDRQMQSCLAAPHPIPMIPEFGFPAEGRNTTRLRQQLWYSSYASLDRSKENKSDIGLPDDHASPQFWIMLWLSVAFHKLWPDNVADSVSHKHGCCHNGLLRGAGNITSSNCDDQADHWPEEAGERIANDWSNWMISPLGFPNHHTASNDRQAAGNEQGYAGVGDNRGNITTKRNENDTNGANGKLE